jgi:hypothetical protein
VLAVALAGALALVVTGPVETASAATSSYEVWYGGHPSKPVRWLACRPIDYRVNSAHMPTGMLPVVKRVFSIIHTQTGASFRYAGTTARRWHSSSHSVTHPTIYLSFSAKHSAAGYRMSWPGTVGWGGPQTGSEAGLTSTGGTWKLLAATYGDVVLYAPAHLKRYGGGLSWQAVILHEVGHALNLAHRSSTRAVMYPYLRTDGPGRFSAIEVKRLRSVLQRTHCDYGHLPLLSPRPGGARWAYPSAPTKVSASAGSPTTATIRWSAPTSTGGTKVIGYRVARGGSAAGGAPWDTVVPASTRSFTFTRLQSNSRYYLVVQPLNALGYGSGMQVLVTVPPAA